MSLLLAATIAAQVVPIAEIDLTAPDLYVSPAARAAVDTRAVSSLVCLDLPARSRKFRAACLTRDEWHAAAERSRETTRRSRTPEEMNGLPFSQGPSQSTGYEAANGRR